MRSQRGRRAPWRFAARATLAVSFLAFLSYVPTATAASGDLAWQRVYNGAGSGSDYVAAAAPAPNGGVFAAIAARNVTYDMVLARYDAAGQRRWLRTYDGPAGQDDHAVAAAADARGHLAVTGNVNSPAEILAVVEYGPGGQLRWARTYDDPTSSVESGRSVALDTAGNVYVAGTRTTAASGTDILLVKYAPSGARRWVRVYTATGANLDVPTGIALDAAGNVYVCGYSVASQSGYDMVTLKYDRGGHRRWVRRWNGRGDGADRAWAMAVTRGGTAYVAGEGTGISSGFDAVVLKYSTGGVLRWSRSRTSSGAFADHYFGIALLGNDDVAATGSSYGGVAGDDDVLLARLSPAGTTRWTRRYNGPDSLRDGGDRVAAGPSGAVYVSGYSYGATTDRDILTLKYGAAGDRRWARRYAGAGAMADDNYALMVNGGGAYVAGVAGSADGGDALLLKYRP